MKQTSLVFTSVTMYYPMNMEGIPMAKKHRHSSNQSLVAHTRSATGSDHNLDAPVVRKVRSNTVHDH
eukprot:4885417-Pleurochrysis_carterae.AAC.1